MTCRTKGTHRAVLFWGGRILEFWVMSDQYIGDNGTALILSEKSVLTTNAITGGLNKKPGTGGTPLKEPLATDQPKGQPWADWGVDDNLPLTLLDWIGKIGVLGSGIDLNANTHFGNGIIWGEDVYTEEGKKIFKPQKVDIWNRMKRTFEVENVMSEVVDSLETFWIAFAEFILSNDKTEITNIKALDPAYCRFAQKDEKGNIKKVYYSSDFGVGTRPVDPPAIDIYDPTDPRKFSKFVLPLMYRTWGKFYYPEPIYYACIRNGWADVASSIPKMLKNIYENQMTLKYIIRVPYEVMKRMYSAWDTPPDCEGADAIMKWQQAKIKEVHDKVNDHLTKPENQYKSLFTFVEGPHELKGIEVEPIKNYLDATAELPNAAAANSELLFALQVDPSMVGIGIPGGKNLSGSGSDKRESKQIKQATLKRERLVSLRVPNLIAVFYGLSDDLYPTYMDTDTSQTMDENPTGKQNVVQN